MRNDLARYNLAGWAPRVQVDAHGHVCVTLFSRNLSNAGFHQVHE